MPFPEHARLGGQAKVDGLQLTGLPHPFRRLQQRADLQERQIGQSPNCKLEDAQREPRLAEFAFDGPLIPR
jgi:hypothetical protein